MIGLLFEGFLLSNRRFLSASGVCLALLAAPSTARAEQRLEWKDEWRRVGAVEYVATGTLAFASYAIHQWLPPALEPSWTRPVLFDWGTRGWLGIGSRRGRANAGTASDVLVVLSGVQPLLVDSLFVPGVLDQNGDVAHQMSIISLQAYALTFFLNASAKRIVARQRPYVVGCQKDPEYNDACQDLDRFRSYYSGHAAIAATGAGLVCAHHTHLPLYGGGAADGVACGGALGLALATGALRILADRHWASDVLTGYLVGFASGYLIPTLLYYGSFRRAQEEEQPADTQLPLAPRTSTPLIPLTFAGRF